MLHCGQRQSPRSEICVLSHFLPVHDIREEGHVTLVYLPSQRVIASHISKHLTSELSERGDELIVKPQDFDALVLAQRLEGLRIAGVELSQHRRHLGGGGGLDDPAIEWSEALPKPLVDAQTYPSSGLMEAGVVVIACGLIETERRVEPRADPFAGVDRAGLQSPDNLASWQTHDDRAHSAKDFSTKSRHPVAQPSEVFGSGDLLGEPAPHLHTGIAGQ